MKRDSRPGARVVRLALLFALAAPALAFAGAAAVRLGLLERSVALGFLLTIGRGVAFAALAAAMVALAFAFGDMRRRGVWALAALLVAGVSAGLWQRQWTVLDRPDPADVSSDRADPPGGGTAGPCPGLTGVAAQQPADRVVDGLLASGFTITRSNLFEVRGVHEAFWFGLRHQAVVRIRPGQTDVRVTALGAGRDGGAACRLALKIQSALQAGR